MTMALSVLVTIEMLNAMNRFVSRLELRFFLLVASGHLSVDLLLQLV